MIIELDSQHSVVNDYAFAQHTIVYAHRIHAHGKPMHRQRYHNPQLTSPTSWWCLAIPRYFVQIHSAGQLLKNPESLQTKRGVSASLWVLLINIPVRGNQKKEKKKKKKEIISAVSKSFRLFAK